MPIGFTRLRIWSDDGILSQQQQKSTTRFNIQQFQVLPTQCICVFCVDLRTNSDYFLVQTTAVRPSLTSYQWLNPLSDFHEIWCGSSSQAVVGQARFLCKSAQWQSSFAYGYESISTCLSLCLSVLSLREIWYSSSPPDAVQRISWKLAQWNSYFT